MPNPVLRVSVERVTNFDAAGPDTAFVQCAVCEKAITGGRWFVSESHTVNGLSRYVAPLCGNLRADPPPIFDELKASL